MWISIIFGALLLFIIAIAVIAKIVITAQQMARNRNRSEVLWGWLAFFYGLFAILVLACLPNINKQSEKQNNTLQQLKILNELKQLLDKEIITKEEFETKKKQILNF